MEKEINEYEKQALDFLNKTNTEFKTEFVRFGKYFDDDEQERAIFNITLKRGERIFTFPFGQSIVNSGFCFPEYIDELNERLRGQVNFKYDGTENVFDTENKFLQRAKEYFGHLPEVYRLKFPCAYDVLAGLQKYEIESFKDFCNDFGYSDDSIKAEKIYKAVVKEFEMIRQLWSDKEIELLNEIN